jgi:ATP-binding cassette subfamily B multidrug efflux pump
LTINPNDNIAVVGESGQGKSTMINLIMRFYDADFGEVLIDDVNVKNYSIKQLRLRMGLVMQEPTLFNYTVKENILYGKSLASNEEISRSSKIANACEFIESSELENAFDSDPKNLLDEWTN